MNQDKAREFFSAYYEGTLEAGLRQQLEARFRADAQLKADYAAFVETMEALDDLRFEEIEVPLYLNDRIATRLEQDEASRRRPVLAWTNWLRNLGYGSLAAAALLAAFVAIRTDGGPSTASLIPGTSAHPATPANRLTFSAEGGKVTVNFRAEGPRTVIVTTAGGGREVQRFPMDGGELHAPLSNPHAQPALLRVTATGDSAGAIVAIPGTQKQPASVGTGSLLDLAAAIAGRYGVPVVVRGDATKDVTWTFEADSALRAAEAALAGTHASADQRDGGLITILSN